MCHCFSDVRPPGKGEPVVRGGKVAVKSGKLGGRPMPPPSPIPTPRKDKKEDKDEKEKDKKEKKKADKPQPQDDDDDEEYGLTDAFEVHALAHLVDWAWSPVSRRPCLTHRRLPFSRRVWNRTCRRSTVTVPWRPSPPCQRGAKRPSASSPCVWTSRRASPTSSTPRHCASARGATST